MSTAVPEICQVCQRTMEDDDKRYTLWDKRGKMCVCHPCLLDCVRTGIFAAEFDKDTDTVPVSGEVLRESALRKLELCAKVIASAVGSLRVVESLSTEMSDRKRKEP